MPPITVKTSLRQQPPPGPSTKLTYPTPSNPSPATNPPFLTDALRVRHTVFVAEQGCDPTNEIDSDDGRSWHWVLYTSSSSKGDNQQGQNLGEEEEEEEEEEAEKEMEDRIPIGVIRLVPPPHAPHETLLLDPSSTSTSSLPKYDLHHEPYIKLTRVAVLREYRGQGLAKKMVEAALEWAAEHPDEIDAAYARVARDESQTEGQTQGTGRRWTGLALVHAQVPVEKMYQKLGFVTDDALGRWHEEGIEHVGMWRRVPVRS
ncbi:hypothetical protein VTN00DRAFT_2392 [Thermoascus crustaceus]|uniref:uncharacterized protein n=1 Tax=Thermoascus crustaceus TaxID=5088 RepID=UPI0037443908